MIGGKNVKKKYIEPEFEILEALLTEDVLYASTGEDGVEDLGGNGSWGGDNDFVFGEDDNDNDISAEGSNNQVGGSGSDGNDDDWYFGW